MWEDISNVKQNRLHNQCTYNCNRLAGQRFARIVDCGVPREDPIKFFVENLINGCTDGSHQEKVEFVAD